MENQTIIVKKIKKGGHGHHGGAWKVAFADFAVAMMAFFLLLWLIASTTKEEKAGMSEYFSPPTQGLADGSGTSQEILDLEGGQKISQGDDSKQDARKPSEDEIKKLIQEEKAQMESLMEDIKKKIESSKELEPFKEQILLDITPEGLRIQIVDKENRPMFDSGSAHLKSYTKVILHELAKTINPVPNLISLSGHTDASQFSGEKEEDYTNWELSADRANASRRELLIGGLIEKKIAKVVGLSSTDLFDKTKPRSASNRRIAIVVLNRSVENLVLEKAAEDEKRRKAEETAARAAGKFNVKEIDQVINPKGIIGSVAVKRADVKEKAEPTKADLEAEVEVDFKAELEEGRKTKAKLAAELKAEVEADFKAEREADRKAKAKREAARKAKAKAKGERDAKRKKAAEEKNRLPADDGKKFIDVQSPISPISPIQLPTMPN